MMVTPEMLLFLAGKMGLWCPRIVNGEVIHAHDNPMPSGAMPFNPATDDAQFGRLVVWAAMNMASPMLDGDSVFTLRLDNRDMVEVRHNFTPDGIRSAAVVAVALALGWEEPANA